MDHFWNILLEYEVVSVKRKGPVTSSNNDLMLTEGKSYIKISHGPMYRKHEYPVIIIWQLFIEKNKQNFPFWENIIFYPYSIYLHQYL